ncbi:unnamed protein product [Lepeophtheirus salmonis]|uniref:(salmon louse) hypothetical protein n=1 Tax=Lepeophtheirus salmonis TaxID=72036 RepID=A0A7R8H9E4_LEPSM|nr:unnamed protein product [Lepeophtheirus salmonis]CAF2939824.1 unnamed protein product [Lepeophtheirus salmonis]
MNLNHKKAHLYDEYFEAKNAFDIQTPSLQMKQEYSAQLEALESKMKCQHLYNFSHLIASERRKDNYLISSFLPSLISSHLQLNSMDGSLSSKVQEIIDNFCGRKVSWDEDLIESSNLDTNEELLGSLYAECVSIAQVEEKTDGKGESTKDLLETDVDDLISKNTTNISSEVDDYELNDKSLPTPQEKEKNILKF